MWGGILQAQTAPPAVIVLASDPAALTGVSGGAFTLIRYGSTNDDLAVNVSFSGTASNGVDYNAISTTLTIPAGIKAVDVPVQPLVSALNTGNKTVILSLEKDPAYYLVSNRRATVKIIDDAFNIPAPTVSIVSPADGMGFTSPSSITLTAEVSDPNVVIKSVSFYANDDLLGRVTNSPYTLVWNNPKQGAYALFSRALDDTGKSSVSTAVNITVSNTPVVTLFSDAENYNVGNLVTLTAQVGDPNEVISGVTFSVNNKVVATVTTAPFVYEWPTVKKGTYNITAAATDANSGKKGTSNKIQVTVFAGGGN
jgi:hypothetical protein